MEKHSWVWVSPVREEEGGEECLCPGLVSMGPVLGKGQIASDRTWRAGASLWSEEEATS